MAKEVLRRFDDMGRVMMPPDVLKEVFGTKDVFYKAVNVTINKNGEIVLTPVVEEKKKKK